MAKIVEIPPERLKAMQEEMGEDAHLLEKYPPDRLYYDKATGKRGIIVTYFSDGTARLFLSKDWNLVLYEREQEVELKNLVECDLPGPDEVCGQILADINEFENQLQLRMKDGPTDLLELLGASPSSHTH